MLKKFLKDKFIIILFCYSFIAKFFHSLASPIFPDFCFQADNAIFYDMGRAIFAGKVLYKDLADIKTPYIYFINGIASFLSYKHIGLYIVESLLIFSILYLTYKIIDRYVKSGILSFAGAICMSLLLMDAYINLGMSKVETYCLPFIMGAFYKALLHFEDGQEITKKDAILYGFLAAFSTMLNLKTAFFFIVLYIIILIHLILKEKKNGSLKSSLHKILSLILFVFMGGIITMLPYIIYMIATGSVSHAIYCIFTLSSNYISTYASYEHRSSNFIESMVYFASNFPLLFILILLSIIIVLVKSKNNYIKASFALTFLITLFYVAIADKSYVYYTVIFFPYLIPIYILFANMIKKLGKVFSATISAILIVVLVFYNFSVGYSFVKRQYDARHYFNDEMKRVVSTHVTDYMDKKVLAFGFSPEVYMGLGVIPSFPCFITMNNTYEASPTFYTMQLRYMENLEPDIAILRPESTFVLFPIPMQEKIKKILDDSYERIEDVDSKSNYGIYQVYIKK